MNVLPEFILVDKPKGITSFDVIRRLRRVYPDAKMGHAGTLDPRATGLMIVGLNKGTKQLEKFLKLSKVYKAEIVFGLRTDTGDLDGNILEEKEYIEISNIEIANKILSLVGSHILPVSIYSAIKKEGKPLYAYARQGIAVNAPERSMTVTSAVMGDIWEYNGKKYVQVTFDVTSGTYIRSLAEELGRRLGVPATLSELRRLSIGEHQVDDPTIITV